MIRQFLILILFLCFLHGQASPPDLISDTLETNSKEVHWAFGLGTGYSAFRDFATSPLFYSGIPMNMGINRQTMVNARHWELGAQATVGGHRSFVADDFVGSSTLIGFQINYSEYFPYRKWAHPYWKLHYGALLRSSFNFRTNLSLGNNAAGVEGFTNLMGSLRLSRSIDRRAHKQKKLLFLIPYSLKPRKRNITYRIHAGLVNVNLRNGYAYIRNSNVLDEEQAFEDYEINIFDGFRMGAQLDFTSFFVEAANNGYRISYIWDAYTANGFQRFEGVQHLIQFAILLNTRKS